MERIEPLLHADRDGARDLLRLSTMCGHDFQILASMYVARKHANLLLLCIGPDSIANCNRAGPRVTRKVGELVNHLHHQLEVARGMLSILLAGLAFSILQTPPGSEQCAANRPEQGMQSDREMARTHHACEWR
jgi:hypothetical protein